MKGENLQTLGLEIYTPSPPRLYHTSQPPPTHFGGYESQFADNPLFPKKSGHLGGVEAVEGAVAVLELDDGAVRGVPLAARHHRCHPHEVPEGGGGARAGRGHGGEEGGGTGVLVGN